MQFIPFQSMIVMHRSNRAWFLLPLRQCYRPERLSMVPDRVLAYLVTQGLIPGEVLNELKSTHSCNQTLDAVHLRQSGVWDYDDIPRRFDVNPCRFESIQKVIMRNTAFERCNSAILDIVQPFGFAKIWIFEDLDVWIPSILVSLRISCAQVEELYMLSKTCYKAFCDVDLPARLRIFDCPNYSLTNIPTLLASSQSLLYLREFSGTYERKTVEEQFTFQFRPVHVLPASPPVCALAAVSPRASFSSSSCNALLPREILCQVMQYLKLSELMCSARQACCYWQNLSVSRCYKPARLSQLPEILFRSLVAAQLLPSVTLLLVRSVALPESCMQQFPLQYLDSLGYLCWDCRDMSDSFYRWLITDISIELGHIDELISQRMGVAVAGPFTRLFTRSRRWTVHEPRSNDAYNYEEYAKTGREIVLLYRSWDILIVSYDESAGHIVYQRKTLKRLFTDVPRDLLCAIMRYLSLRDVLAARSLANGLGYLIPLKRCYKPSRMSQLPVTLFKSLLSHDLLPSARGVLTCRADLSAIYLQQLHLVHFDSITQATWDVRDMPFEFYLFCFTRGHSFQLDNIKEVIFDSGSLRILERFIRVFPNCTKWAIYVADPTVTYGINSCDMLKLSAVREVAFRYPDGEIIWRRQTVQELFKISVQAS